MPRERLGEVMLGDTAHGHEKINGIVDKVERVGSWRRVHVSSGSGGSWVTGRETDDLLLVQFHGHPGCGP